MLGRAGSELVAEAPSSSSSPPDKPGTTRGLVSVLLGNDTVSTGSTERTGVPTCCQETAGVSRVAGAHSAPGSGFRLSGGRRAGPPPEVRARAARLTPDTRLHTGSWGRSWTWGRAPASWPLCIWRLVCPRGAHRPGHPRVCREQEPRRFLPAVCYLVSPATLRLCLLHLHTCHPFLSSLLIAGPSGSSPTPPRLCTAVSEMSLFSHVVTINPFRIYFVWWELGCHFFHDSQLRQLHLLNTPPFPP